MIALLDTDVCVDLLRQREPSTVLLARLRSLVEQGAAQEIAMSSVTLAELEEGLHLMPAPRRPHDSLLRFASAIPALPFDDLAARAYGALVADSTYRRARIGPLDELIAAHAVSLDALLVTGNVREFQRVPSLRTVSWRR